MVPDSWMRLAGRMQEGFISTSKLEDPEDINGLSHMACAHCSHSCYCTFKICSGKYQLYLLHVLKSSLFCQQIEKCDVQFCIVLN
ncbi:hypothetical protein Patl1_33451 [Pistacia atlantica]|uniref:Uncharacterized protein n=1 Tax=Pistacia atlantica TaxID=434234 RepID=A0ACC0ZQ38_9ROSI|nr:hypothetical protein Patl1_33451 [Pistacia atlantica]